MAIELPDQRQPAAEVQIETPLDTPQNDAVVGMSPKQVEELKDLFAVERQKTLLEKAMNEGVFDPKKLDFKNSAQVRAAEELIFKFTGQKVRYSPEADIAPLSPDDKQRIVLAREAAHDEDRAATAANRVARADANEAGKITTVDGKVFIEGFSVPAAPTATFTADVEKQKALDAELAANTLTALRRDRAIALSLDGQPEGAQWDIVNTQGDLITVSRVDRLDANGDEIQDPMNWKVVQREIRAGDVRSKHKGRLLS